MKNNDIKLKDVLFVFYTATYIEDDDEKFGLLLGADKFLRKPVEPEELIGIIKNLINDYKNGLVDRSKISNLDEYKIINLYNERLTSKLDQKVKKLEDEIRKKKIIADKLKISEERLRSVVVASKEVIWELDLEGNWIYVSPQFFDIYG